MSEENRKSAGAQLKAERERLGLSLRDIATTTKINAKVLEAIENGDVDTLPAKPFARGFLRSYAQYLKLDPQAFVEAFDLEDHFLTNDGRVEPEEVPEAVEAAEPTVPTSPSNTLSSKVIYIVAALFLILLIIGVKKVVDRYANERVQTENLPEVTTTITPIPSPTPDPNNPAALADALAEKLAAEANQQEESAETPELTPAPTPVVKPTSAPVEPEEKEKPEPTKPPTKKQAAANHELIIEALDKVNIETKVDDSSSEDYTLKPGAVKTIKAKKSIRLEVSDGGLVNIIYNGKDLGNPGDLGKSKKVSFP